MIKFSRVMAGVAAVSAAFLAAGCGSSPKPGTAAGAAQAGTQTTASILAAENEYGNVAAEIGGRYVRVNSVESNPNTDPHTYEVTPGVAKEVAGANILIENGLGYDSWMDKLAPASPNPRRMVINAQRLLGLPNDTPNPHLCYKPVTMPAVAKALAVDLSKLQPSHASYFWANVTEFDNSLKPWLAAIATFKATYLETPVATTEPVADYMLEAAGTDNLTPWGLQAAIMNGIDPTPQEVTDQTNLLLEHKVKVFLYNQQVTDPLTVRFLADAKKAHIPVVGVYETMPPGYDYQSWMLAEVNALTKAVADNVSTQGL